MSKTMDIIEMTALNASPEMKYDGVINPYLQDCYHMGTKIGHNVEVMFEKFENENHKYIVVVNKVSGERIKIQFKE